MMKIFILISVIYMINGYPSSNNINDQCLNYCSNDGICVIIKNQPQCYCLPEWTGEFCEIQREFHTIQIDSLTLTEMSSSRTHACSIAPPNLCNGGLCQFKNNEFSCACPAHLFGQRCELPSPCNNFCKNGGICSIDDNDEPECNCTELYTGTICHLPVTIPPENTTTTTTTTTTPHPLCPAYQKQFCKTGTCAVVNGALACQCPSTHSGQFCEIEKGATPGPGPVNSPTVNSPTVSAGTVNPGSGTDNACSSNPCFNGRPCYNNGNTFYCFCGNSYIGSRCETSNG